MKACWMQKNSLYWDQVKIKGYFLEGISEFRGIILLTGANILPKDVNC